MKWCDLWKLWRNLHAKEASPSSSVSPIHSSPFFLSLCLVLSSTGMVIRSSLRSSFQTVNSTISLWRNGWWRLGAAGNASLRAKRISTRNWLKSSRNNTKCTWICGLRWILEWGKGGQVAESRGYYGESLNNSLVSILTLYCFEPKVYFWICWWSSALLHHVPSNKTQT